MSKMILSMELIKIWFLVSKKNKGSTCSAAKLFIKSAEGQLHVKCKEL
jgi:hypothetical protein